MKCLPLPRWRCTGLLLLIGAVLISGCSPSDAVNDSRRNQPADRTAQITVWTDAFEVFAEHPIPVAGKPTPFITHVTDLLTQEPRRDGPVTFRFSQGDVVVDNQQANPTDPGVYRPAILFPKPGIWQVTLIIPGTNTPTILELGSLQVHADPIAAARSTLPVPPEGVTFLKEQQWRILVRTEPVARRPLTERMGVSAQVRSRPGSSAAVVAPISGQLIPTDPASSIQLGDPVEAGQLLGLLRPNFSEAAARLIDARAAVASTQAALDQAETAHARIQQLAANQAKSLRELQESAATLESTRSRHTAALGLLNTFQSSNSERPADAPLLIELRAPIAGILDSHLAGVGEVVAANQPLFHVLDWRTVWIEARIPESSLHQLGTNHHALLQFPGQRGSSIPVTDDGVGRVLALGGTVDPRTRTVPLTYEVHNRNGLLRPGQSVTLQIGTAHVEEAVAVPENALVDEGDELVAFIQLSGETFAKRTVRTGIRDAGLVQILDGLQVGERVVTRGAYAIRLASISGVIPAHGHNH